MKKGMLSFLIHLILFVGSGIIALTTYLDLQKANGSSEGFEALALGIVLALFLVLTVAFGVSFLINLIHVLSGAGFFGFLGSIVDLGFIAFLAYSIYSSTAESGGVLDLSSTLPIFLVIAALFVSFIGNVASMKR
jgi:hypothetical protein